MNTSEFLEHFFSERGEFVVKPNNEADVLCPFPHDKGYETRPSAHVNVNKGTFHCKTCQAEGRWSNGGLSETSFISRVYNITYAQALKYMSLMSNQKEIKAESWQNAELELLKNQDALDFLTKERGLTLDTIELYRLGYIGVGVSYPVFVNNHLLDVRTYNINREPDEPKIKSQTGATNLLFPYDHWKKDSRPTVFCAGENDTLLNRQMGFNSITVTFGEGSTFPKIFLHHFVGQKVYICYDCDEAGKQGSKKLAFQLKEAGAVPYIVNLGLSGEKDDKDITDFYLKHRKTADDFQKLVDEAILYNEEEFIQDKNQEYPLVPLWEISQPQYYNKYISSRVLMMGKYDRPMETPSVIKWECLGQVEGNPVCAMCKKDRKIGYWFLEDSLRDLMYLVEVNEEQQNKYIHRIVGLPPKCPNSKKSVLDRQPVQKVILSPDVETEDELSGYKGVEQYAYAVGAELEDGQRYRAFFKRFPHPLQSQFLVAIVDKVEESDSEINRFKITPETIQELSQFQGNPFDVMKKRYENAKEIVGAFTNEMVAYTVDIVYHSVLDFKFDREVIKGHPEALVIGASRTGKSDTALKLQQFYGVGNFTECKTATTAGLLGGADRLPSGGYKIKWGKIPRNHKGMLVLDELSGMQTSVMSTLTGLRSQRVATLEKIVSGKAPAKTRLLWISNPRVQSDGKSLNVDDYPNGVKIVLDLVGSDEDIARFDFVFILPNIQKYTSPIESGTEEMGLTREEYVRLNGMSYRRLIHWVWSRTIDQIKWANNVEEYVWQRTQELNERFDTDVKFFGAEAWKKLARIAVAVAGCCFSHTDNGHSILVEKEHVDWAVDFMCKCYDNDVFRLPEFVKQTKMTTETNPEINTIVAGLIKSQPIIIRTLMNQTDITLRQLEAVSGLDRQQFNEVFNNLIRHNLIQTLGRDYIMRTKRLKKAVDAYVENYEKERLVPLSMKGDLPI